MVKGDGQRSSAAPACPKLKDDLMTDMNRADKIKRSVLFPDPKSPERRLYDAMFGEVGKIRSRFQCEAGVAQMAEQRICNPPVVGSMPTTSAITGLFV